MAKFKNNKKFIFVYVVFIVIIGVYFGISGNLIRKGIIPESVADAQSYLLPIIFLPYTIGCIFLFPSIIVMMLRNDFFKKDENEFTKQISCAIILYIVCILFMSSLIYYFCYENSLVSVIASFYSLSNDGFTPLMSLMQLISGVILNALLLGMLLSVFQSRIENKDKLQIEKHNVLLKLENESHILIYELKDVIKK